MYVRTKKGEIFDCCESEQMHKPIYYPKKSKTNGYIDYEDVYKKSDNIIDILEVGDYVNGLKVFEVMKNPKIDNIKEHLIVFVSEIKNELYTIYGNEIKSIVTKEQFESIKYEVN